jgi:REP element-mobilizing transposase RayT
MAARSASPKGATLHPSPFMPQSLVSMNVHIVFSTKNREPHITPELQPRLHAYMGGIIRGETGRLLTIGGMPDHVHLLVNLGRTIALADLVRFLKSNSSRWVHETFPNMPFAWQAGYRAFSVSASQLGIVRQYVQTQVEYHRTMNYQDELREFLRRHEIEWDERYVWD